MRVRTCARGVSAVGRAPSIQPLSPQQGFLCVASPRPPTVLRSTPTREGRATSSSLTVLPRINGHPGKSVRLAGRWKLEEVSLPECLPPGQSPLTLPPLPDVPPTPQCHLSGCMMDLFLQMAIIMGLKQTLSNCAEYLGP